MLVQVPHYRVSFVWSPAHTLTETLRVEDTLVITGAFLIADLEEWVVANMARAKGWNLETQITQVVAHLHALRATTGPDGTVRDFMEWDRVTTAEQNGHPTGDARITVDKVGGTGVTTIVFDIMVAKRAVPVTLEIARLGDVWAVAPPLVTGV